MRFSSMHHGHKRHGVHSAKSFWLRLLDILVYITGVLGPLATIPQVLQIYTTHTAAGVSFLSWSTYALFDIPWIIYAIVRREPPLIVCYLLWFFFNVLVAIGVLLYGPPIIF